ncbi:hypothetical protein [Cellvibrio sp. NN19]|uniref:hypothetical protein n=1 Tax=Cellvibrio chitinivorans TaxID=3102792 RepID=UPI002B406869|nr:hypothetical protein [Cellvibrio sp. NN19]
MQISRIPKFTDQTLDGMSYWFSEMYEKGLLFHPDESPENLISIKTGEVIFNSDEITEINMIMSIMFSSFGDLVYEAAYPYFMKNFHIQG